MTAAQVLQHLDIFDEVIETESGWVQQSSVRWVTPVFEPGPAPSVPVRPPLHLDDVVADFLEPGSATSSGDLDVWLTFHRHDDGLVSATHQQALAMLRGELLTEADRAAVRSAYLAERRLQGEAAMAERLDAVVALGGEVVEVFHAAAVARVRMSAAGLSTLALRDDLQSIAAYSEASEDAGHATTVEGPLDGVEIQDLIQSIPLYLGGYRGEPDERIGLVETRADEIHNEHVSFLNGLSTPTRRVEICGGTGSSCTWLSVTQGAEHPTKVGSILASDLTLGQDSLHTNATERRRRSGVARDSSILAMAPDSLSRVVDIMTADPDVFLLNQSASNDVPDPTCAGTDSTSRLWNEMFVSGISLFNSAGNNGHVSTTDCTVGSPGSAIGVMTINTWKVNDPPTPTEVIHSQSARGGTSTEGGGRKIIDLLGPTGHSLRAEGDASANPQYAADTHRFGITSAAAPTVTGAAALFRSWYLDVQSTLIDDPGIMYANLLLMGDGLVGLPTETYQRNGFDNLYGAGRLRLRTFDAAGLDGPAQWMTGRVCVAHNQTYDIPLNGGTALPTNAHYIKAVTWWYDAGHDQGLGHDHYVLKLIEDVGGGFGIVAEQDLSEDNRQRVFRYENDVAGSEWFVRIFGADVSSDDTDCGTDSNRVFYAILWEDNRRDDDTTLETHIRPEAEGD